MAAIDGPGQRPLVDWSREVLARHARTFDLAGRLLPAECRDDAAILYAFCRHADDLADEATDLDRAREQLGLLKAELRGEAPAHAVAAGFLSLSARRAVSVEAAIELIVGIEGDLDPVRFDSDRELLRYAYRVAGTVGLMMCGVLGVTERAAVPHAIDLGIAMQLTNISRDVAEDALMGRVYLPGVRLAQAGGSTDALLCGQIARDQVARVVADVLAIAETYYNSAAMGFRDIPLRPRVAIAAAAWMYRAIGRRIAERGYGSVLDGRTVATASVKAQWIAHAIVVAPTMGRAPRQPHCDSLHRHLDGLPGANIPIA